MSDDTIIKDLNRVIETQPKTYAAEVWGPTMQLRFAVDPDDPRRTKVLQQKWVETSSGRTEWRNVPSKYID